MPAKPKNISRPGLSPQQSQDTAIQYIRAKIDQLLTVMGTLPLRPEELDDATLIELDPIGIIAGSFEQVLEHLKQTNHELTIARNEIRSVFDSIGAAVIVVSADHIIGEYNRQAVEWLFHESDPAKIIGHPLAEVCTSQNGFPVIDQMNPHKFQEFSRAGRTFQLVRSEIYGETQQIEKYVYLCSDITVQKHAEEILTVQASTDELTGIANRRQFDRVLKSEIQRASRYHQSLALIMLDIDHFKKINDVYGHQTGDNVLVELAVLISGIKREQDFFARWGGEEFVILSPSRNMKGVKLFAEKLRLSIEAHTFPEVGRVTCSLGLSEYRENEALDNFFSRVDAALYRAKQNGRNRIEVI